MSPRPGVLATRRTAIAGVVGGALALGGCDGGDPTGDSSGTPSPTAATTTAAPADPDQALVDEVVAELDELIGLTAAAAAARRRIAPRAAAFEALHRAHREVLTDDELDEDSSPSVTGSAKALDTRITRRERQAQARLAEWAVAAQSGPLARLLASMSAAIAQQLVSPVPAVA